jgi:hypothetical protein
MSQNSACALYFVTAVKINHTFIQAIKWIIEINLQKLYQFLNLSEYCTDQCNVCFFMYINEPKGKAKRENV